MGLNIALCNPKAMYSRKTVCGRRLAPAMLIAALSLTCNSGSAAAARPNIFKNGDFESGLMCYDTWQWSKTGRDFLGDYEFFLSTDTHSGNYAGGIRCTKPGGDCMTAAIFSDRIITTPGRPYKVSLYTKCPIGQTRDYLSIEAVVDSPGNQHALTCNGSWAYNEFNFAPTTNHTWFFVYDVGPAPLIVDDIVMTYADGAVPDSPVHHEGVRKTSISGQTVFVDGSPYLALGFFNVPYEDIPAAAATHANTVQSLQTTAAASAADCYNTGNKSYLDALYEAGLNFIPHSDSASHAAAHAGIPAAIAAATPRFAKHLANIAWFLADEPDHDYFYWIYIPGPQLVAEHEALKGVISIPIMSDFQRIGWEPNDDVPYANSSDIWMAEPYGPSLAYAKTAIDNFNALQRRPIWLAQDAIAANLIVPKAYWVIIKGATGISYFSWNDFKAAPRKLAAAAQAFVELSSLQHIIFAENVSSLASAPPGIGMMARRHQGTITLLTVNPALATATSTFQVQGLKADQKVTVLFENRTLTAANGSFTDIFTGVSRHVYVLPPGIPSRLETEALRSPLK